jgi:hypothetical protein
MSGHPLGEYVHLFDFNLGARSLWILNDINSRGVDRRFEIVDKYMENDPKELLDSISAAAGFKKQSHIPQSTGPVVTIGIMALISQLYAFSREYLRYNMGYEDTSGQWGGGIRKALNTFKASKNILENNDIRGAYRYFYLENTTRSKLDKPDVRCLFDLSGKVIFRDDSEIELLPAYIEHKHKIHLLATPILLKANL